MTIRFKCSSCQTRLVAPDVRAGSPGKCPACGQQVTVPQPTAVVAGEAAAAAPTPPPEPQDSQLALNAALARVIQQVPECVAAGYVDMSSGFLLGINTVESHPSEVIDLLGPATAELFQGSLVEEIELLFRRSRGTTDDHRHLFRVIAVLSDNLLHVFVRSNLHEDQCLTVVARKSASLGIVMSKVRELMSACEQAI